jgi:hypothetical protein
MHRDLFREMIILLRWVSITWADSTEVALKIPSRAFKKKFKL